MKQLFFLASALLLSFSAMALSLSDAKQNKLVREQPNGYIVAVKSSNDVQALVQEINAKRKAQYQKIAKANKISLSAVEKQAGAKLSR